ncbi:purple acid phosphatase [Anaeramoeba flamelloides]|uniref:Purple acid phosphatase n=1 Tax=Anaeramoeba flamelloides TaxID=1746091 RepID=A0AAV8AAD5_9EUKA|nr:purple acid phosphatase [Anaeramoeba flamelloides]
MKSKFVLIFFILICFFNLSLSFRFTVTADPRDEQEDWIFALQQIKEKIGGIGEFHVTVGDQDPEDERYADFVSVFGESAIWCPVWGNHDIQNETNIIWLREFNKKSPLVVNKGPEGSENSTFSWDVDPVHFVVLNEQYNGSLDHGIYRADIVDELYDWLVDDLEKNKNPSVIVFGHAPAYPQHRHLNDSLNNDIPKRDRFWKLMNQHVEIYFCGHTHWYSAIQVGNEIVGQEYTYQIDAGAARWSHNNNNISTFLNVFVNEEKSEIQVHVWQSKQVMGEFEVVERLDIPFLQITSTKTPAGGDKYFIFAIVLFVIFIVIFLTVNFILNKIKGNNLKATPNNEYEIENLIEQEDELL